MSLEHSLARERKKAHAGPSLPNLLKLLQQVEELRDRVEQLERGRSKRGVAPSKAKAAAYCGRSDEWLRQRERDGKGPERTPNGDYFYDALDRFLLAPKEAASPPPDPADLPQPRVADAEVARADSGSAANEVAPRMPAGRLGSVRARATQQTPGHRGHAAAE
jgi:hypothetical protein